MRIVTGDLHLSHNPRDSYRFDFMTWLEKYARKRKPDQIVIAGDLTEEKDRHPAELVNKVVAHVHALAQICPVVALEGNHDYKDEGHAFFAFLSRIPNTRWISKPTVIGDVLFLPHTNNYKRDWADIDLGAYDTRVCHQTFTGASVGFGRALDGIPLDVLPRNGVTLCGDIHVPQTRGHRASSRPVHRYHEARGETAMNPNTSWYVVWGSILGGIIAITIIGELLK
jgi:predicted phosphodiesterase